MFWLWILVIIALILHMLLDVDVLHFVRVFYTLVSSKWFRSEIGILESSEIYGICLPRDADFTTTRMSSSRYLREYGFAHIDLTVRNGVMGQLIRHGGIFPIAIAAITIRYRLPIRTFSSYKIITTPLWWDDKYLYVDQRVITLSDSITRTVGFTKIAITKLDLEELVQKLHPGTEKPEISEELKAWIEANDLSRELMKTNIFDIFQP